MRAALAAVREGISLSASSLQPAVQTVCVCVHAHACVRACACVCVCDLYGFNSLGEEMPCLYVGDRQGAKGAGLHGGPNDPVIEGVYTDYEVDGPFDTDFRFSRFGVNSHK